jgi:diaminopropionate ammonia-lyase
MPELAAESGVAGLWIKDESTRMGLGSFKALGGAYAVGQMIADACGTLDLMGDRAKEIAADMTFITASAGNHGLSVAAGAKVFGAQAVIVLGPDVPESFADRIRALGADVIRAGRDYDDSIVHTKALAAENDWLLLADGSWQGYTERPAMVMEGYTVLAEECRTRFAELGTWPSHVLLQAGVGGMAAAVAGHIRTTWAVQPTIVVVEPDDAPCLLDSVRAGHMVRAQGEISNMGRLDCKEASLLAFDGLRRDADIFVTVSDADAQYAADKFAAHGVGTTPSGAAGLAGLLHLSDRERSSCLVIVSEGPEIA